MTTTPYRPRRSVTRYRAGQAERCCAGCDSWLPETLEHFYRQRREDGNSRWATHCKPCERERALMTYYARREAAE